MRTCVTAYLPPETDSRFDCVGFLRNLDENRPANPLILFSDAEQPTAAKLGFDVRRFKGTFDRPSLQKAMIQRPGTASVQPNRAAINNLIWLTAVRLVEEAGFSHLCYLEEDVRVKNPTGTTWDTVIFNEFFAIPRPLFIGGSTIAYNAANWNRGALERYERFLIETKAAGRWLPIPPYGWLGATDAKGCCVFVNGAGGVYSVAGLNVLFPERANNDDIGLAGREWAWDFSIALRGWEKFKEGWWEMIGYLPSVCSQYGNVLSTPQEREQWLAEGKCVLIHQQKRKK